MHGSTYTYSYDRLHRLVEELAEGYFPAPVNTTLDYVYDDTYQPHAVKQITLNSSAAYDYTYDDNGNMESGPDFTNPAAVASRSITYNADNMPIAIVHGGTVTTSFVYDGAGVRARKTVSGGVTTYYIGEHYEIKDGVGIKYIFAGSRRVAKIVGNTIYYFHKDHLGSSTVMTDAGAGQVEYTDYLPFGGQREHAGSTFASYRYTDQELDPSTGLYNYDARLYDPVVGRFVTADNIIPDWYDPQALNRYAYVLNNPLKYSDPTGQAPLNNVHKTGRPEFDYGTGGGSLGGGGGGTKGFRSFVRSWTDPFRNIWRSLRSTKGASNSTSGPAAPLAPEQAPAPKSGKIPWGSWKDYQKVTVNGQEYAQVGNRLYSRHAIDRMQPSGMRYSSSGSTGGMPQIRQTGGSYDYGRSVAPQYVEDAISSSTGVVQPNGNISHLSGSLEVILNPEGAVVTIITH